MLLSKLPRRINRQVLNIIARIISTDNLNSIELGEITRDIPHTRRFPRHTTIYIKGIPLPVYVFILVDDRYVQEQSNSDNVLLILSNELNIIMQHNGYDGNEFNFYLNP